MTTLSAKKQPRSEIGILKSLLLNGMPLTYVPWHSIRIGGLGKDDQIDGLFVIPGEGEVGFDFYLHHDKWFDDVREDVLSAWQSGGVADIGSIGIEDADDVVFSLISKADKLSLDVISETLSRWVGSPLKCEVTKVVGADSYSPGQPDVFCEIIVSKA